MHRKAEGQEGKECSAALDNMIWLKPKDPPQPSSLAPGGFKHSAQGSGRCWVEEEWRDAQGLIKLGW